MTIPSYKELHLYQLAVESAMNIFELAKAFPVEERFALVSQVRRSSRSVCANIAEAWPKRRYPAHFVSKLSDAQSEAEETRVWLEFAFRCRYLAEPLYRQLDDCYDKIVAQLALIITKPEQWTIR